MYGVGRKALPRSVKLWYYMRPFFLNSAVAAILRAVIRCRVHPELFSWEGARNVRALSVRFGSEGSILIEIYLSWPFIRRLQRRIRRDVYSRACGRVYNSPLACILFPEGIWGAVLSKRYIKVYNRPHTLSEQDQAEGHDRHAAHHAVDRDVGFAVFAGGRQQFVD